MHERERQRQRQRQRKRQRQREREREEEREGERDKNAASIVTLKLAMTSHFPSLESALFVLQLSNKLSLHCGTELTPLSVAKNIALLKVHCHAIQCFYVDFFAVKNGGQETRGRSAGERLAGIGRTFLVLEALSFAIDRRWNISQLPMQSRSSLEQSWRRALSTDQESES